MRIKAGAWCIKKKDKLWMKACLEKKLIPLLTKSQTNALNF